MNGAHATLMPAIILLFAGILSIAIMRRARLSPIIGYLVAGVLIGPHALGLIHESETTHLLAELGVVFLLFDIGLHFTLSSIWEARRDIFGLGPLQIVLCGAVFVAGLIALGVSPEYAVIVGGALALSSTAVVAQTLAERGQQNCPVGLTAMAVLIFQDILAIFLLVLAASFDGGGSGSGADLAAAAGMALVKTAVAIAAAIVIGNYAIRPLFRLFAQTRNEEVFTALALLVVLATAAATSGAALSLTLGAFLGGMIISETPYRHVIQTEAKPFRNLLLGFFFITVGMSLDWRILLAHWHQILLFLIALVAVKAMLVAVAARAVGWSKPGSFQLGFMLAQGSEFVFVIIAMPAVQRAMGEGAMGVVVTGVAASLALTPTLAELGSRLAKWMRSQQQASVQHSELTPNSTMAPVVIFGMDTIGRTVADALEAHTIGYDAIEGEHDRLLSASADGYPVAFGVLRDHRTMETLAYGQRKVIVVTRANYDLAQALTPAMHERYPELPCYIAVESEEEKRLFESLGLHPVVNRSVPCGLDLAAAVLRLLSVDEKLIHAWMERQHERALQASSVRATELA